MMNILRVLAITVTSVTIASTSHGAGFGCGLGWGYNNAGCGGYGCGGYDCNYAQNLWAGYQPTQPIYVPSPYGCGGGCAFPRLAGALHGGGACDTSCCGGEGFYHFSGCGDSCGLGGCLGSKLAGAFARLKAHCGGAVACCDDPCAGAGYDINFSYPGDAGCTGGNGAPATNGADAYEGGPVIEGPPSGDHPPAIESQAPPMMEQDAAYPSTSAGPFDSNFQLHETAPPAVQDHEPAELLPPSSDDEALDGDA